MSTDEISIRRCNWLLKQRGFRSWRETEMGQVLPLQETNPDFLVETPAGIRFLMELKSFEKDTILRTIQARTFSLGHMTLQKRANRLVRDAAEQLLPYAGTNLPMVIALDNYRQVGISLDKHTLSSLFGELEALITIDLETGGAVRQGWTREDDGSPLAGGRNQHVSAVLVLEPLERFDTIETEDDFSVERGMRVRIVYNEEAVVPLPKGVVSAPEDEHLN